MSLHTPPFLPPNPVHIHKYDLYVCVSIAALQSWLFKCLLSSKNAKLGPWSIRGKSHLTATHGFWVSLVLQNIVVRRHFMTQRSRKQSPVIFHSEWRLVPAPSRQLGGNSGLMLCTGWVRVWPSLQIPSLSTPLRVQFHSATNELESYKVSGSLVKKYRESKLSDNQAPKRVASHIWKKGDNDDDNNLSGFIQERRTKSGMYLVKQVS